MYSGNINSNCSLKHIIESGQTYQWRRVDGEMFDDLSTPKYSLSLSEKHSKTGEDEVIIVSRKDDKTVHWESTFEAEDTVKKRLGLDYDISEMRDTFPDDKRLNAAISAYSGLRVPSDPVYPTLISFICSAQMRVERIFTMQKELCQRFGRCTHYQGDRFHVFPDPHELKNATEEELRGIKLGYRAPYVNQTVSKIVKEDNIEELYEMDLDKARKKLKEYTGVGNKVSDCVLLFGLDFDCVAPLDTWMGTVIEDWYPDLKGDSYRQTSENFRHHFGEYAGHAQAYLFKYARDYTEE
jgi:N-glycosylase/DNA lyase